MSKSKSTLDLVRAQDICVMPLNSGVWLLLFLLYFPKINLVPLLSPGLGLKAEDVVCGLAAYVLTLVVLKEDRIERIPCMLGQLAILLLGYIAYLVLVTVIVGGDLLYIGRYSAYYAMLLFGLVPVTAEVSKTIERIALYALIFYVMVGVLQKYELIGGFHTGAYISQAGDRVPILFANATEAGLISVILVALVLGSSRGKMEKSVAVVAAGVLNALGGNRTALLALLVVASMHVVEKHGRRHGGKSGTRGGWSLAGGTALMIAAGVWLVLLSSTDLGRGAFALEGMAALGDVTFGQIEGEIQPTDISYHSVGRSVVWDVNVDESLIFRLQKWTYAINLLLSGFVFGIGAGNGIGGAMDGFAFRILIESGYLGLAVYIAVLLVVFRIASRGEGFLNGLHLAVVSVVVQGIFLDSFYFSRVGYMLWLLVGLKVSAIRFGLGLVKSK